MGIINLSKISRCCLKDSVIRVCYIVPYTLAVGHQFTCYPSVDADITATLSIFWHDRTRYEQPSTRDFDYFVTKGFISDESKEAGIENHDITSSTICYMCERFFVTRIIPEQAAGL